jgi:hypothetical protein
MAKIAAFRPRWQDQLAREGAPERRGLTKRDLRQETDALLWAQQMEADIRAGRAFQAREADNAPELKLQCEEQERLCPR